MRTNGVLTFYVANEIILLTVLEFRMVILLLTVELASFDPLDLLKVFLGADQKITLS